MNDAVLRPDEAALRKRAEGIIEESDAYPGMARERLLTIKRVAIQELIDKYDENSEIIAKYYPGYAKEDLRKLLSLLPNPSGAAGEWHL